MSEQVVPNLADATRTIRGIASFLKVFDPPLANVPAEREPVVHVLWGWWMWLTAQAMYVVDAAESPSGIVTIPLVRSVGEHADLMLWLTDAGPAGMVALYVAKQRTQQSLWDSYVAANGQPPAGVERTPDKYAITNSEEAAALALLSSVQQRADAFNGVPYYVFRALSDHTHAGLGTARVFAPVDRDGLGRLLHTPDGDAGEGWPDAGLIDCAVRACQAGLVFAQELKDPSFSVTVETWCRDLGLEPTLPSRRPLHDRNPSREMMQQAALSAAQKLPHAQQIVEQIGVGSAEPTDPSFAYRAVRSLLRACNRVLEVEVRPPHGPSR